MDLSKIEHTPPRIRTARLENGKWQVLDSIANAIVQEVKYRHYGRVIKELNKARRA